MEVLAKERMAKRVLNGSRRRGLGGPDGSRVLPRIRILHLLAPAPFGGLEQVVKSLAGAQAAAGHDVHVGLILEPGAGSPILSGLEAAGIHAVALRLPPRAYRRERALVRELCMDLQPDVVHTHGYRVDVLHGSVAAKLGIPRVSTSHGFVGGDLKNRFYERLQRRALRRFDGVVAVSAPMAATLAQRGIPADRLHTVPNAWTDGIEFLDREEARRMLQIPADEFHVGFIGRIGHEKGPDVLLEALSHLERPAATTFIGEGRLRDALAGRAEALGLDQTVRWAGLVQDAARLIRAFDAVVLSSRTEGTPVVLLEAMAAGVPVIAAAVGGIPHIVGPDEASLVPAEDPPALAAAIRDTRDDPRAAAGRAARASQRLRGELSADQWLERYDRVYIASGVGTAVRR